MTQKTQNQFGAHIEQKKLTYREAGSQLGCTDVAIGRWAKGQRTPTQEWMRIIFFWSGGKVTPESWVVSLVTPAEREAVS